jgi:hypothetical protein
MLRDCATTGLINLVEEFKPLAAGKPPTLF